MYWRTQWALHEKTFIFLFLFLFYFFSWRGRVIAKRLMVKSWMAKMGSERHVQTVIDFTNLTSLQRFLLIDPWGRQVGKWLNVNRWRQIWNPDLHDESLQKLPTWEEGEGIPRMGFWLGLYCVWVQWLLFSRQACTSHAFRFVFLIFFNKFYLFSEYLCEFYIDSF